MSGNKKTHCGQCRDIVFRNEVSEEESSPSAGMVANVNKSRKRKNNGDRSDSSAQSSQENNANKRRSRSKSDNDENELNNAERSNNQAIESGANGARRNDLENNETQGRSKQKAKSRQKEVVLMVTGGGQTDFESENESEPENDVQQAESITEEMSEETQEYQNAENEEQDRLEQIKRIDAEVKEHLLELKQLMKRGGMDEAASITQEILDTGNANMNALTINEITPKKDTSEETIYRRAVKQVSLNRLSSSSNEDLDQDSSNELIDINQMINYIAGAGTQKSGGAKNQPQASTSKRPNLDDRGPSAEDKADKLIQEAELAKGKIFTTSGKNRINCDRFKANAAKEMIHLVLVDEEYSVVGSHLDKNTVNKIRKGEYVDFAKLIPRDKIAMEEDNHLQPVYKDGQVFWQPPVETTDITNYHKLELAFRVFSKVYTMYHPQRATELIQYGNDIHTASLTFTWDNVYMYDKEFRLHMDNHPM